MAVIVSENKELIMMMMSCVNGYNLLIGGSEELEPDMDFFEDLARDCIKRCDKKLRWYDFLWRIRYVGEK